MTKTEESRAKADDVLDVIDRLIERAERAEAPTYPLPETYLRAELRDLRNEAEGLLDDLVGEEDDETFPMSAIVDSMDKSEAKTTAAARTA